jgi:alcohol dehydrogenase
MKAWQLERMGGALRLAEISPPEARPGTIVVRVEAAPLLSYQRDYVTGALPHYQPPDRAFTLGSGAIATVHAVGRDVWHLQRGQRVAVSPHLVAHEQVAEPATFLLGLTAYGPTARRMQEDYPDGTFAEYAVVPASSATPVPELALDPVQLAVAPRFVLVFGGLLRGRLAAGETVVVTGATGTFGSAAVLVALALGAARVVAAGRNREELAAIERAGGSRVEPVALTGDVASDAATIRTALGGGADLAFDMIGRAKDPHATLAGLRSLRRGGRLVLMGSLEVPLPIDYREVMMNDFEIIGQFMYPGDAFRRLFELVRGGLLDLRAVTARAFPLAQLPAALDAAAAARSLECIVLTP